MGLGTETVWGRLVDRLSGPGGLYSLGIAVFLVCGVGLQVTVAFLQDGAAMQRGLAAAAEHLVGNPSALAISLAMLIFCWSGEEYRRAWKNGPQTALSFRCRGDLISGVGALVLAVGLFLTGEVLLAVMSGTLHVFGKIGSAASLSSRQVLGLSPAAFRVIVLVSRGPAICLFLVSLVNAPSSVELLWTLPLLGTYALWIWADLLLVRADRAATSKPQGRGPTTPA